GPESGSFRTRHGGHVGESQSGTTAPAGATRGTGTARRTSTGRSGHSIGVSGSVRARATSAGRQRSGVDGAAPPGDVRGGAQGSFGAHAEVLGRAPEVESGEVVKTGLCIAALLMSTAAFAQSPPGPYVIDVRGSMSGTPGGDAFYPPVPENTLAPQRGFGFGAGAHLYPFSLGISRVGVGIDLTRARGSARSPATTSTASGSTTTIVGSAAGVGASMTVTTVAPQLSFNFGTHDGWSYLSAGVGVTSTRAGGIDRARTPDAHHQRGRGSALVHPRAPRGRLRHPVSSPWRHVRIAVEADRRVVGGSVGQIGCGPPSLASRATGDNLRGIEARRLERATGIEPVF